MFEAVKVDKWRCIVHGRMPLPLCGEVLGVGFSCPVRTKKNPTRRILGTPTALGKRKPSLG